VVLSRARKFRQLVCIVLSLAISVMTVSSQLALAQGAEDESNDWQPPTIEHERGSTGFAGEIQEIVAEIVDDKKLLAAVLFYRFTGDEKFASVDMIRQADESTYTASIETSADDVRDIEYFIQAEDTAGNRAIKGFTFDPLVLTMAKRKDNQTELGQESTELAADDTDDSTTVDANRVVDLSAETNPANSTEPAKRSSNVGKIIWGLVGLAVVAAIAITLSDDGDGKGNEQGQIIVEGGATEDTIAASRLSIQW